MPVTISDEEAGFMLQPCGPGTPTPCLSGKVEVSRFVKLEWMTLTEDDKAIVVHLLEEEINRNSQISNWIGKDLSVSLEYSKLLKALLDKLRGIVPPQPADEREEA